MFAGNVSAYEPFAPKLPIMTRYVSLAPSRMFLGSHLATLTLDFIADDEGLRARLHIQNGSTGLETEPRGKAYAVLIDDFRMGENMTVGGVDLGQGFLDYSPKAIPAKKRQRYLGDIEIRCDLITVESAVRMARRVRQ